ncbi:MAG: radical SAM protein [Thermoguttaceae bacterium]|nr:radical SAM protein [Thermoguttaceae bacterium]
MELSRRPQGDTYTTPGHYRELEAQLRRQTRGTDVPTLFIYAFDPRTRIGPFVFCDRQLIPGAPQAVGSALYAAGFTNTRLVLQQRTPNVRPSAARIGGKRPEILMVSAMQIHSAPAYDLIRDAWTLEDQRPLILAGGAKAIYEPWDFFGLSEDGRVGADVVITGEEYVLLELLDRILEHKGSRETMRQGFERVRRAGLLDDIPGLVFRPDAPEGPPPYLVSTGVQRLVQDLDELPLPFDALGLFEPPHKRSTLAEAPLPAAQLKRLGRIMSTIVTHGCKFHCPYCPIPGYNQRTFRYRSPDRLTEEMAGIAARTGVTDFFGADDNFFNNRRAAEEILTGMARAKVGGRPFRDGIWFGTEATEFDVHKNQDLLPLARDAGLRAIWFGIEDLTAELVKKGQSPEKTREVFALLRRHDIAPMAMMMHHDGQPLWSWKGLTGLLNQVGFLRRAGAVTCQITLLTPSVGSRGYEQPYRDGIALKAVGGVPIEDYQLDGNHAVATSHAQPWKRQWNMLLGYAAFYNPMSALRELVTFDGLWKQRVILRSLGIVGLARSIWNGRQWLARLFRGPIERHDAEPRPKFRLVEVQPAFDPALPCGAA